MSLAPAAISIIFNEEGTKILLVKRVDVPIWVLPGGGIDAGETVECAVKREALEETGYKIAITRQSGEYYPINRLAAETSVFICHILEGSPHLSAETAAISFFPLQNLPESFFSLHRDWLSDALTSTVLVKKPISQVTYWAVAKLFLKHPLHILRYLATRLFKK